MIRYFINFADREILFYLNGLMTQNEWLRWVVLIFARYAIVVFVAVGIYLWFRKSPKDHRGFLGIGHHENRQAVVFALLALAVGFTIDIIISHIFVRTRPFVAYPDLVRNLALTVDLTSFPSKHAIAVFASATSIWLAHLWHFRNWGIFLFVMAFLIAFARVAAGVHYPSDIIAGMIIGVFSAWIIHENQDWIKRKIFKDFQASSK
jgi:undecaprenyl-diphosphatase